MSNTRHLLSTTFAIALLAAALPAMREALGLPAPVEQAEPATPLDIIIPPATQGGR